MFTPSGVRPTGQWGLEAASSCELSIMLEAGTVILSASSSALGRGRVLQLPIACGPSARFQLSTTRSRITGGVLTAVQPALGPVYCPLGAEPQSPSLLLLGANSSASSLPLLSASAPEQLEPQSCLSGNLHKHIGHTGCRMWLRFQMLDSRKTLICTVLSSRSRGCPSGDILRRW